MIVRVTPTSFVWLVDWSVCCISLVGGCRNANTRGRVISGGALPARVDEEVWMDENETHAHRSDGPLR